MERPRHQAGLDRRPLLAFTYRCSNFASKEAGSRASVQLVALEQHQLKAVHLLKGRTLGYHFGMDCRITDELIAMAEHDRKVSDELAASGALYEGYDPRMAAVHEKNALRLRAIMAQIGWPTERLVGKRAADAAWLIAQHAISHAGRGTIQSTGASRARQLASSVFSWLLPVSEEHCLRYA